MAAERSAAPAGRTQLRDLVRERRAELGLSYERLAARCVDAESREQTVKGSWLHRLESGERVTPPDVSQLRGLAAGLEVPLGRIQDAAGAEFFGMDIVWSKSEEARAWVERADKMTPKQREQLMRLLDAFEIPE